MGPWLIGSTFPCVTTIIDGVVPGGAHEVNQSDHHHSDFTVAFKNNRQYEEIILPCSLMRISV